MHSNLNKEKAGLVIEGSALLEKYNSLSWGKDAILKRYYADQLIKLIGKIRAVEKLALPYHI